MRVPHAASIILILLVALVSCGAAQAASVENVRLLASAPTHLQVDWQGQASAYRIVYSEAVEAQQHTTSPVRQGPFTLVDLVPETEYILKVQALEPGPEGDAFRVIGESQTLQVATGPWQPREWEDLLRWPSRHVPTFPGDTAHPAIAAYKDELLVVECYEGAIYVSQINPETLEVHSTKLVLPAEEALSRTDLDAVVIKDALWVTWVSEYTNVASYNPVQMLTSYDLKTAAMSEPVKLHRTITCGLVAFNGQPWALWRGTEGSATQQSATVFVSIQLARYNPLTGLQEPEGWVCGPKMRPMYGCAVDLGIELLLASLQYPARPGQVGRRTLWGVKYNGQDFYGSRMLRGVGPYSSPTGAAVNSTIVLAYAKSTDEQLSDIDITLTSAEAGEVTSTSYIHDGTCNITPDAVAIGDCIYLVYNKWSARAGSPDSVNYGTFIGKIELKF